MEAGHHLATFRVLSQHCMTWAAPAFVLMCVGEGEIGFLAPVLPPTPAFRDEVLALGLHLADSPAAVSHRHGHGCFLSPVWEALPGTERAPAAHGGPRRRAQLHLQRVQPHLSQSHSSQAPPSLTHR